VKTSIPLHRWLMAHPAVRSGEVDTGWLEREFSPAQLEELAAENIETAAVAAALVAHTSQARTETSQVDGTARLASAWRLAGRQAALH
jgi:acetyl/propionyl-CoA carboxylase alpha subunit